MLELEIAHQMVNAQQATIVLKEQFQQRQLMEQQETSALKATIAYREVAHQQLVQ